MEELAEIGILVLLLCVCGFSMFANRLSSTVITAPIVFLVIGFLFSKVGFFSALETVIATHVVAEIALIILLFLDASQIKFHKLKEEHSLPLRMLIIGLPLSVLLGTVVGLLFFPDYPWILIALIAAILAPTDAALGDAIIHNHSVPAEIRQTVTVESGLNDGLALPIILFLASFFSVSISEHPSGLHWMVLGGAQIILGLIVGLVMGYVSGKVFIMADSNSFTSDVFQGIAVLALAGATYITASLIGGNGFIAAFIAGLIFGNLVKKRCQFIYKFTESEGQILVWVAFACIGGGLLPDALHHLSWSVFGYILLSLFIVRPLAIYLSLVATRIRFLSKVFLGWFGPRGLATALFALIVSKDLMPEYTYSVLIVAINAVWISAFLHGMTAAPFGRWYGKWVAKNSV